VSRKVNEVPDTITVLNAIKKERDVEAGVKLLEDFCEAWRKSYAASKQRLFLQEKPEARLRQNKRSKTWYKENKESFNKRRSKKEKKDEKAQ